MIPTLCHEPGQEMLGLGPEDTSLFGFAKHFRAVFFRGVRTFFGARVCPQDHPQHAGKSVGAESFKPLRLVLQTQPRSAEEFCHAP
jgi:hypothetical protein